MSISTELQGLVFTRLTTYAPVTGIIMQRVYDRIPEDVLFPYVSFGPSDYVEDDADCITGRVETMQIDCWSRKQGGYKEVKELSDAVKTGLHNYNSDLGVHALVEMRVLASRFFRDPDGQTSHAVMTIEAILEEK